MRSKTNTLYTDTISAITLGMQRSRQVEVLYHSSVGSEGKPGNSITKWPANYPLLANLVHRIFPVFTNVTASENLLASAKQTGTKFIVFRPALLTSKPARGRYRSAFNTTSMDSGSFPLKLAKISISREDTAQEILRVALLPPSEREPWYGQGVYLADLK